MDPQAWHVLALLLCAGILYNGIVDYFQKQLPNRHGVTAWLVVGGVSWTLVILSPVIGLRVFLLVLGGFVAAGTPMIIGSMRRYEKHDGEAR